MSVDGMNGLAGARSAYLRSAMHQPVEWMEWGAAAFARAAAEDKPVLLDIGAVWCHWCHVMDRESYENAETAALINEHFVAVKVDRDERPDVDARYQAAVSAISGQGGWPLTAFLTPEGKPFFGGTYFPPVDGHGRPSLRRVLLTMAEAFQNKRAEVDDSAASVMAAIEHNETFNASAKDPGAELAGKIVDSILKQFDGRNGGFGAQPKFPHAGALDLLLDAAGRGEGDVAKSARLAAMVTLERMAKGGIYDQLAGGFHRYSVDERWVVPHFEKMSYDNSELLKNYVHAWQLTGEPECERVARETLAWVTEWLADGERGGFYASQDADYSLEDDGDYFTWTRAEAAAVLSAREMSVAGPFWDIGELGDMHHNPEKNVLHVEQPLATVAAAARMNVDEAAAMLAEARAKLYAARRLRPTPYVDRTVYTGWNAMMASAFIEAGRVLEDRAALTLGLKSVDRALEVAWKEGALGHVVAYGEGDGDAGGVAGVLDDYVQMTQAALDAWQATGAMRYFEASVALMEAAIGRFYDKAAGGFFDTVEDRAALGALSARRKPLQDSPTPAGNSVAATVLLRLAELTGREDLRAKARATLECFAGVVEHFGLYAASYGLALERMVRPQRQVVVVGGDAETDALERAALARWSVDRSVVWLQDVTGPLPPALAETLPHLAGREGSFAVVCEGFTCQPPMTGADALRELLERG